jgi:hypothetical protein
MALPNFLCVGAEKAGTTPLCRIICRHPQIFLPKQKELHYFSRSCAWESLTRYEGYGFKSYRGQRAVGEATPEYMRIPEVPERIFRALGPDVRLIFCLREPVRRAFSQYLLRCRLLEESESFETAIGLEARRIAESPYLGWRRAYVGGSRYAEQIERFLRYFPRENMFFMVLETDFLQHRADAIGRLLQFLGVDRLETLNLTPPKTSNDAPKFHFGSESKVGIKLPDEALVLGPADIAVWSDNDWANLILVDASAQARDHVTRLRRNITETLSDALADRLYRENFVDEISRVEDILGRDLSFWRR